jgi:hypothetical protein
MYKWTKFEQMEKIQFNYFQTFRWIIGWVILESYKIIIEAEDLKRLFKSCNKRIALFLSFGRICDFSLISRVFICYYLWNYPIDYRKKDVMSYIRYEMSYFWGTLLLKPLIRLILCPKCLIHIFEISWHSVQIHMFLSYFDFNLYELIKSEDKILAILIIRLRLI